MSSRSLVDETSIQSLGLTVQVLDITLDKGSGQEDGIEFGLLDYDRTQRGGDLGNKGSNNVNNSISFFSGDGDSRCAAVGTGFLETSLENLFLVVNGKSSRITTRTGESINLYLNRFSIMNLFLRSNCTYISLDKCELSSSRGNIIDTKLNFGTNSSLVENSSVSYNTKRLE
jgi:hypothetical protein